MDNESLFEFLHKINNLKKDFGKFPGEYEEENFFFKEYINEMVDRIIVFNIKNFSSINKSNCHYIIKAKNSPEIYSGIVYCYGYDFHLYTLPSFRKKSNIIQLFSDVIMPHYKKLNSNYKKEKFKITFTDKTLANKVNSYISLSEIKFLPKYPSSFLYDIYSKDIKEEYFEEQCNIPFFDYILGLPNIKISDLISSYSDISTLDKESSLLINRFSKKLNLYDIKEVFNHKYKNYSFKKRFNGNDYETINSHNIEYNLNHEQIYNGEIINKIDITNLFKDGKDFARFRDIRKNIEYFTGQHIYPSELFSFCIKYNIPVYYNKKKGDYPKNKICTDDIYVKISLYEFIKNILKLTKSEEEDLNLIVYELKSFIEHYKSEEYHSNKIKYISISNFLKYLDFKNFEGKKFEEKNKFFEIIKTLIKYKCIKVIKLDVLNLKENIIIDVEKLINLSA